MTAPLNVLGLDVGDRRIGVALANLVARIPEPLLTIDRSETDNVFETIDKLILENEVQTVVIGLPRGLEGQETGQTQTVRQFAKELKEQLGVKVELQDEAGTSVLAEEE